MEGVQGKARMMALEDICRMLGDDVASEHLPEQAEEPARPDPDAMSADDAAELERMLGSMGG